LLALRNGLRKSRTARPLRCRRAEVMKMMKTTRLHWVGLTAFLVGCGSAGSESGSSPTDPAQLGSPAGGAPSAAPSDPQITPTPPAIPPGTPDGPPSSRPPPQSSVRDCGVAKTSPSRVDARMTVPSFYKLPLGAYVIPGVFVSSSVWASGTATRLGMGVTSEFSTSSDDPVETLREGLLIPTQHATAGSGWGVYSNLVDESTPTLAFLNPSSGILTYAETLGQQAVGWDIADPHRTANTSNIGTDLFARGLIGGRFFGWQIALLMPSDCAVGALGDALGRTAFLTDATRATGIFDPAERALLEDVLVKNGAEIFVRVLSNEPSTGVDALFKATTCSTADLAACKKLTDDLIAQRNAFVSSSTAPPALDALQSGADPSWTTTRYDASPVSILAP
jgi:hypothetical protein